MTASCPLCDQVGGHLVCQNEQLRVIRVLGEAHPVFYRVIWNAHIAEWTDLPPPDRSLIMQHVAKVETVLRQTLKPTKINIASLGNAVPHLHWHVVARFDWDAHWPLPIWAEKQRNVPNPDQHLLMPVQTLDALIASAMV